MEINLEPKALVLRYIELFNDVAEGVTLADVVDKDNSTTPLIEIFVRGIAKDMHYGEVSLALGDRIIIGLARAVMFGIYLAELGKSHLLMERKENEISS